MKTPVQILLAACLATPLACGLFDDDVPPGEGGDGSGGEILECIGTWDLEALQGLCPDPYTPQLSVDIQGDTVLWIDDPTNATTIGPAGWLFGNVTTADWLGFIAEGDAQCGVACVIPQGHPCLGDGNQYCVAGEQSPGCMYCGPGTAADCESFVANACDSPATGEDGSSGADSTGGGGAADTSGGQSFSPPDVSMFTTQPDETFGTTQLVLDNLGPHAPPNLLAEDICDVWDPAAAVSEWFGDPILQKEIFNEVIADAEVLLGYCDHLQLSMLSDGVEIVETERRSLAYELGFRSGDVVLSLNGVSATDPLALREELIAISQQNPGLGTLVYRRDSTTRTRRIQVQ